MRLPARNRRSLLLPMALLLAAVVVLQVGFAESGLLYLAPALALLLPLVFGRYPGERLLRSVADRCRDREREEAPAPRSRLGDWGFGSLPRGGGLLASALAGRAPPLHPFAPRMKSRADERKKKMRRIVLSIAAACALAMPAAAQAHVSLHPNEVPTGSFATLDIRVPNESDTGNTVKLAVQVPAGFTDVSPEYLPGWSVDVKTAKLAKPVQTADGLVTEGVRQITWTGKGAQGRIPPGQFLNFPISTEIPGKAGQVLTFKVLQFYDNGEVVRWIGPPESENPAPSIDVTAAGGVLEDVAGSEAAPPSPGEGSSAAAAVSSEPAGENSGGGGGASKGLAIAALVTAVLGLLAGTSALVRARRNAR